MSSDAQQLYRSIVSKQAAQEEAVDEPEFNPEDRRMYLRKAKQGHIYGRTRHPSLEGKDDGRSASTSSEWSDTGGARPETAAIQRDDGASAGESGATDESATETVGIATGGADEAVRGATARGANSGQRKSARHTVEALDGLGGAE